LFVSIKTPLSVKQQLDTITGFRLTDNLGRYLGAPLIHGRVRKEVYFPIVERVQNRFAGWKAKLLSLAGRETLIKSTLSVAPTHIMQTAWLPSDICKSLDRVNQNFLWGSHDSTRKLSLVRWDKVTKTKDIGGLGIRETRKNNIALLGKMVWQLICNKKCLWVDLFSAKYGDITSSNARYNDSPHWKTLRRAYDALQGSFRWRVGTGTDIDFWTDIWVNEKPFCVQVNTGITLDLTISKVSDVIESGGRWNAASLRQVLPSEIAERVMNIPFDPNRSFRDKVYWANSQNGEYTTKSAYWSLTMNNEGLDFIDSWKWVWKIETIKV
ncbi:Putative ribonuclease H protein At1g65750, partial [Linum perenne]